MRPLSDYTRFIELLKKENFPVKLRFGLEVCYSPEHEKDIEKIKSLYPFDFLTGSIHFMDGYSIMQNGGEFCDFGHGHFHVFPRYKNDGFGWTYPEGSFECSKEVAERLRRAILR